MKQLNVNLSKIKHIVISHDHWDHRGGLQAILKEISGVNVYVCPGFAKRTKNRIQSWGGKVIEAGKKKMISSGVWTTGEIGGTYKSRYMPEQALLVKTNRGISIITGCAHPGIHVMVKSAEEAMSKSIEFALGGFHLKRRRVDFVRSISEQLKQSGVKRIAPVHCTGEAAKNCLKREFGGHFLAVKTGESIVI
jgi:7,8-dihydropterin-6-yl-methyl-4-(beta-D-ribofuranosyl)aminobenzene 5'-phosphate synthase